MTPDMINGAYEALGAVFISRNCLLTWRAKEVKGVSVLTMMFFTSWGVWNLYYYPSLDQWWSFWGGVGIATANCFWIWLTVHFVWTWRALPKLWSRRILVGWWLISDRAFRAIWNSRTKAQRAEAYERML